MDRYIIKLTTYPVSQHPNRFLEVVNLPGELPWVMEQYQRNRHPFEYEIVDIDHDVEETEAYAKEIKYKYSEEG